jgi:hypothetical protein
MRFKMTWPPECVCGETAATVGELAAHVVAGNCKENPPERADGATTGAFLKWVGGRKWGPPMDPEVRAALDARNADPAVKAARREARRRKVELRRRMSAPSTTRRATK